MTARAADSQFADSASLLAFLARAAAVPSEEGLPMSELDHGLQCAAALSASRPDDVELQVAGLVHDVGHAFASGDAHGRLGAAAVRPVLGARVATLVEAHVPAKRYLVTVDAAYRATLSPGSIASLALQGDELEPAEVARLAAEPWWDDALELRRADDAAKVPGADVPLLDHWVRAIERLAAR